jgi:ornithine cyclodeaminase/alanine dehydrogenase-like protein (mu-crystallin family)
MAQPMLVLGRRDVAALLPLEECIVAVGRAFRLHAEGTTPPPGVLGIHAGEGGFHLKRVYAFDTDRAQAERFAAAMSAELGIRVEVPGDLGRAVGQSGVCVTCTPARRPFLRRVDVAPGMFVAAVGADSEDKQELDPALLASSAVVVDILEQCATIGELHHALAGSLMTRADVHAELGEVVAGRKPGRTSTDEVIIFDSTGTALQDVAAAAVVYEKARAALRGLVLDLAG